MRLPAFGDQHAQHLIADADRHVDLGAPHAIAVVGGLGHVWRVLEPAIQERLFAQALSGLDRGRRLIVPDFCSEYAVACGFIHEQ